VSHLGTEIARLATAYVINEGTSGHGANKEINVGLEFGFYFGSPIESLNDANKGRNMLFVALKDNCMLITKSFIIEKFEDLIKCPI
jgi:hypothetical protein